MLNDESLHPDAQSNECHAICMNSLSKKKSEIVFVMQSDLLEMVTALSIITSIVSAQLIGAMQACASFIIFTVQASLSQCIGMTALELSIEPAITLVTSRSSKT